MNSKAVKMTQFSILVAIEAIFCFTPLGSLPAVGPIVATLAMVPVIITALLLGTGAGTVMGAIAGLFSFIVWTFMPPSPAAAFVFTPFYAYGGVHGNFWSLVICFVPRALVGSFAGLCYQALSKAMPKKEFLSYLISGAVGSLTNTFLVLGGIMLFFGDQYEILAGKALLIVVGTTVLTNGIPEAIVSAILAPAVCRPVKRMLAKRK